jgi:hypothetical protein
MRSSGRYFRNAPGGDGRRIPSFKAFLKMGGVTGMVRRIVYRWNQPFTVNQLKVAFHHRHPELIPGDHQIEDIVALMAERRFLIRMGDGSFQRPQIMKEAA